MSVFTPRLPQHHIYQFAMGVRRGNIFASPGTGKTGAGYTIYDMLRMMGDVKRCLVLGPKRVAKNVWPSEREKWIESFGHLKVAAAIGTPEQRKAAVMSKPDLLSINYENIDWLVDGYGEDWPFDMVIADECFVAGTPVSTPEGAVPIESLKTGSTVLTAYGPRTVTHVFRKETKSLVEVRLVDGTRFVCTPSHRVWTQDGWKACGDLGPTDFLHSPVPTVRSAFLSSAIPDGGREPGCLLPKGLSHASLHGSSNGDRERPHHGGFTSLARERGLVEPRCAHADRDQAEAQCGAEGTEPCACRQTRRERPGDDAGRAGLGSDTGARLGVELRDTDKRGNRAADSTCLQTGLCVAGTQGLSGSRRFFSQERSGEGTGRQEDPSFRVVGVDGVTHLEHSGVREVWDLEVEGVHEYLVCGFRVHNCTRLKGLRVELMASGETKGQGSSRAKALSKIAHRKTTHWLNLTGSPAPNGVVDLWGQQWFVDGGLALGTTFKGFEDRWFHTHRTQDGYVQRVPHSWAQAEIEARMRSTSVTIDVRDYYDIAFPIERILFVDLPSKLRPQYLSMEKELFANIEQHAIEVFTAGGKANKLLQMANGSVFYDTGEWVTAHDEKLEALKSLVEEFNGEPILVRYIFKPDRDRILKAFPRARLLDDKKSTEDAWNRGEIPLLVTHGASAGHGLSLQMGGRVLVDYGSNFNLEEDEQIIERIGPTRQFQSGLDRAVYRTRIVARDTIEEHSVLPRLQKKISVQDAFKEAMKIRR